MGRAGGLAGWGGEPDLNLNELSLGFLTPGLSAVWGPVQQIFRPPLPLPLPFMAD